MMVTVLKSLRIPMMIRVVSPNRLMGQALFLAYLIVMVKLKRQMRMGISQPIIMISNTEPQR